MLSWVKAMWRSRRREFIAVSILILTILIVFPIWFFKSSNTPPAPGITSFGGGALMFLLAVLATIGAVTRNNNKGLWILASSFWAYWLYPKIIPLLSSLGINDFIRFLLFILVALWIFKKGTGRLGYRVILAIILLFSVIDMQSIANKGIQEIKGVIVSNFLPQNPASPSGSKKPRKFISTIANLADSTLTKTDALTSRGALISRQDAQVKKTWKILPGTVVYDCSTGNSCFPKVLKYRKETEVISLGEAPEIGGITYEKCSLPDEKTGQPGKYIGWIISTDLKLSNKKSPFVDSGNLFDKIVIDSDFPKVTGKIYPPDNYTLESNPPSSVYLRIRAAGSDGGGEFRPLDSDGKISVGDGEEGFAIKATSDTIVYVYN